MILPPFTLLLLSLKSAWQSSLVTPFTSSLAITLLEQRFYSIQLPASFVWVTFFPLSPHPEYSQNLHLSILIQRNCRDSKEVLQSMNPTSPKETHGDLLIKNDLSSMCRWIFSKWVWIPKWTVSTQTKSIVRNFQSPATYSLKKTRLPMANSKFKKICRRLLILFLISSQYFT